MTIVFPVNLGHGVALKVGYRFCIDHGAKWIVTIDADGQNDPDEIPVLLAAPHRRRDGLRRRVAAPRDATTRPTRRASSASSFFSAMMNLMTGAHLTDTSNGYRALRVTMLADVVDRLDPRAVPDRRSC